MKTQSNKGRTIELNSTNVAIGICALIVAVLALSLVVVYPTVKLYVDTYIADKKEDLEDLIKEGQASVNKIKTEAEKSRGIVALLSDFGVGSYYANLIKGKILQPNVHTSIVDISHEVRLYDEIEGAWILQNASQYFPDGTIFWGMINPGAELFGNSIFIITKKPRQYFIGASRKLFENVIATQGLEAAFVPNFDREDDKFGTTTFAELINVVLDGGGVGDLREKRLIGEDITSNYIDKKGNILTTLVTTENVVWTENSVSGDVCSIDRWGNLLTNIKDDQSFFEKGENYSVFLNSRRITGFIYGDSYEDGNGKTGVIIEQDGWIQVAFYQRPANESFGVDGAGDNVVIRRDN